MQSQLRDRVREALSMARHIALSTGGPADTPPEVLPCEAVDLALYVLVPKTSDLLFDMERQAFVVATADTWQARGTSRLVPPADYLDRLAIARMPEAEWCQLAEIRPTQLQLCPPPGEGEDETIYIL